MRLLFFILLFVCFVTFADDVYLTDGTVLKGNITSNEEDTLDLNTQYLGILKVSKKDVEKIQITNDNEALKNELEADIKYFNANMIIWDYEKSLTGKNQVITPEEEKNLWLYRFDFSASNKSGNVDQKYFSSTLAAKYEEGDLRINTALTFQVEDTDDSKTKDYGQFVYDYEDKVDPHSWYSQFDYEYDKVKDLDYRVSESLGYAHYFFKTAEYELRLRVGGFVSAEKYSSLDDPDYPAGLDTGLYGFYRFENKWKLVTDTGLKVDIHDFDNYTAHHESYFDIPLTSDDVWSLKVGVRHEFDNMVPSDVDELDTNFYLKLSIGWLPF